MTRTNLIEALSAMGFQHGSRLVMIDEPVRDYLVDALRRR